MCLCVRVCTQCIVQRSGRCSQTVQRDSTKQEVELKGILSDFQLLLFVLFVCFLLFDHEIILHISNVMFLERKYIFLRKRKKPDLGG